MFSLESLYPLTRQEVSEAQTNIGSKILFWSTRILLVRKNFVSEFGTRKNLWSEKSLGMKNILGQQKFVSKEIWFKKILVHKN